MRKVKEIEEEIERMTRQIQTLAEKESDHWQDVFNARINALKWVLDRGKR